MGFSEILLALNSNIKKPLDRLIEELTNRIYNIVNNSNYGNSAIKNAIDNVDTNVNRGVVKSVQRGVACLRHQLYESVDININSVDMSKSIILVNTEEASTIDSYYSINSILQGASVSFETSSKIKIEVNTGRYSVHGTRCIYVSWQVIEFY
ncbi:MAG: hypothetical protein K2F59_00300 [Eubacteriales bacterium]|nr:hypothetical protein [Eubacteriales bacterium]